MGLTFDDLACCCFDVDECGEDLISCGVDILLDIFLSGGVWCC